MTISLDNICCQGILTPEYFGCGCKQRCAIIDALDMKIYVVPMDTIDAM